MSKKKERGQRDQVPPHQPVDRETMQRAIWRHRPHAIGVERYHRSCHPERSEGSAFCIGWH